MLESDKASSTLKVVFIGAAILSKLFLITGKGISGDLFNNKLL